MFKRIAKWLVLAVVLLAVILGALFYISGQKGSSLVEQWIASELKAIAKDYLNPELEFADLDYQYPSTVILTDMALTVSDPLNPGQKVRILAVKTARLTLAEIPASGKPLRLSEFILEKPEFRAIALKPGSSEFAGFSHLLKQTSTPAQPNPNAAPVAPVAPAAPAPTHKLSDVFAIKLIDIQNATLVYDPRLPGTEALRWDDVSMRLDVQPDAAGWYEIKTAFERKPVFATSITGKVNIDTMSLKLDALKFTMDLAPEQAHYLPPQLQAMLNQYELTGKLDLNVSGTLQVSDWQNADLNVQLNLNRANASLGKYRIPIDTTKIGLRMKQGQVFVDQAVMSLLGGEIRATAVVGLLGAMPAEARMTLRDIRIERTLRTLSTEPGAKPAYAGAVNMDLTVKSAVSAWQTQTFGEGQITMRDGEMRSMPLVRDVLQTLNSAGKIGDYLNVATRDTALVDFTLAGDRMEISKLEYNSAAAAARGKGQIYFDQRMNILLNAGPLEKLQNQFGAVGRLLGGITDSLMGYRIVGTVSQPEVKVEVGPLSF